MVIKFLIESANTIGAFFILILREPPINSIYCCILLV